MGLSLYQKIVSRKKRNCLCGNIPEYWDLLYEQWLCDACKEEKIANGISELTEILLREYGNSKI